VNWKGIVVIVLDFIASVSHGFTGCFSTPNPINELKLFIRESNISEIKLISDGPPPVLIFRFTDKLRDFIVLFLFSNLLEMFVVTEVFELIIPAVGNASNFNLSKLILLIQRFVVTELLVERMFLFTWPLRRCFSIVMFHLHQLLK